MWETFRSDVDISFLYKSKLLFHAGFKRKFTKWRVTKLKTKHERIYFFGNAPSDFFVQLNQNDVKYFTVFIRLTSFPFICRKRIFYNLTWTKFTCWRWKNLFSWIVPLKFCLISIKYQIKSNLNSFLFCCFSLIFLLLFDVSEKTLKHRNESWCRKYTRLKFIWFYSDSWWNDLVSS